MVIYVTSEVVMAVKPRASANEDTTRKPLRTVVTVRSTSIRSVVIVAIRTCGLDSDVDVYPGLCFGGGYREANRGNRSEYKIFNSVYTSSSMMAIVRPPYSS